MNKKLLIILALAGVLVLTLGIVLAASAVSGAAFTTFNPWVDGEFKDVCKNSQVNCNIYGSKPDVWLNGGPAANGLGPDGQYFFAVLVPGGQPDPNDDGPKNLSYPSGGDYNNRTFTVTDGEVSLYGGTHDQDSGDTHVASRPFCGSPRGCAPDGLRPFIRLDPYADTWNPGGVYILAICSLADDYPVEPRDCKYDAFKVKEGQVLYEFMLKGWKFKDWLPNGPSDRDRGLGSWPIHISGTGFSGESIDATVQSDADGFWDFGISYTFNKNDSVQNAVLTICELPIRGWYQTYPVDDGDVINGCYIVTIDPAAITLVDNLDFGNWFSVTRW